MSSMEDAFRLVSRSTGFLANALGKNKAGRKPLAIVVKDLRTAADIIEGLINA